MYIGLGDLSAFVTMIISVATAGFMLAMYIVRKKK